jgi:hypothetical protein
MGVRRVPIEDSLRRAGVADATLAGVRQSAEKQGVRFQEAAARATTLDPKALAYALSALSGLPVLEVIDSSSSASFPSRSPASAGSSRCTSSRES